jgi:hypothetical protein
MFQHSRCEGNRAPEDWIDIQSSGARSDMPVFPVRYLFVARSGLDTAFRATKRRAGRSISAAADARPHSGQKTADSERRHRAGLQCEQAVWSLDIRPSMPGLNLFRRDLQSVGVEIYRSPDVFQMQPITGFCQLPPAWIIKDLCKPICLG